MGLWFWNPLIMPIIATAYPFPAPNCDESATIIEKNLGTSHRAHDSDHWYGVLSH